MGQESTLLEIKIKVHDANIISYYSYVLADNITFDCRDAAKRRGDCFIISPYNFIWI